LTPKSLLREPLVNSPQDEFTDGKFQRVLADPSKELRRSATRVILCSGKIAIDLLKRREQTNQPVAVIRVEQLYPLPEKEITAMLEKYPPGVPVYWVQEEPQNMGPWHFMKVRLSDAFQERWPLKAICRHESASPATGSKNAHKYEQEQLIDAAMEVAPRLAKSSAASPA
jgi:2-oxoglutarate dehydrogenase E1 component